MEKLQFKTNINCGNCIAKVKPFLNEIQGIQNWEVDTNNPNKILTVEVENVSAETIIDAVEDLGFDIEKI